MNIFMGWVFRTHVTLEQGYVLPNGKILDKDLHGCPVGFAARPRGCFHLISCDSEALTAMQQVISFICFISVCLGEGFIEAEPVLRYGLLPLGLDVSRVL